MKMAEDVAGTQQNRMKRLSGTAASTDERTGTEDGAVIETVVKGDAKVFSIAAASIIAKVTRDRIMAAAHARWPEYEFATHKGYPTKAHQSLVHKHGPCPIHRMTFAPLKRWWPAADKKD